MVHMWLKVVLRVQVYAHGVLCVCKWSVQCAHVCLPPHDSHCQIPMRISSLPSAAGATLGPAGSSGDVPCSVRMFLCH